MAKKKKGIMLFASTLIIGLVLIGISLVQTDFDFRLLSLTGLDDQISIECDPINCIWEFMDFADDPRLTGLIVTAGDKLSCGGGGVTIDQPCGIPTRESIALELIDVTGSKPVLVHYLMRGAVIGGSITGGDFFMNVYVNGEKLGEFKSSNNEKKIIDILPIIKFRTGTLELEFITPNDVQICGVGCRLSHGQFTLFAQELGFTNPLITYTISQSQIPNVDETNIDLLKMLEFVQPHTITIDNQARFAVGERIGIQQEVKITEFTINAGTTSTGGTITGFIWDPTTEPPRRVIQSVETFDLTEVGSIVSPIRFTFENTDRAILETEIFACAFPDVINGVPLVCPEVGLYVIGFRVDANTGSFTYSGVKVDSGITNNHRGVSAIGIPIQSETELLSDGSFLGINIKQELNFTRIFIPEPKPLPIILPMDTDDPIEVPPPEDVIGFTAPPEPTTLTIAGISPSMFLVSGLILIGISLAGIVIRRR